MNSLRGVGVVALTISTALFGASCTAFGLSLWAIAVFLLIAAPVQWLLSTRRTWAFWTLAVIGFLAGALSPFLTVVILAPCVYVGTVYGVLSVLKFNYVTGALTEWGVEESQTKASKQKNKKPLAENPKEASASPFPWDPKSPHYQVTHDPKLNLIPGNIYSVDD